jgi:hypothetical protein
MFCQNCKATLPESAKFCTMCGAKINVSFCANGHVLEPGEADCRYCPPAAGKDNTRISVSTTVEKFSYPAAGPASVSAKLTSIDTDAGHNSKAPSETDADHTSRAPSPFGTTMIMQEKEEEPVGLLGWLVIIDGPDRWRDFKITKRKTTIGRSRECDFVLEHGQVSAKHASIRLMDDGLYLTDLDSSNGTFVNDQEVMIQKLSDNEIVRLGEVILKYKSF